MTISIPAGTIVGGDFRIERPLRTGGMGAVYVATQLSTERTRALKVMSETLAADDGFVARFTREARVSGRIASDHVVEVVAAGLDPLLKAPWMAMELLEGEELGDYLRRVGALSLPETTEILSQVIHAVGAAHRAGIVHRDLKPENLFLTTARRRGSNFTVKVLDFGIAKVMADVHAGTTAAMGSPLWMAPEQATRGASIGPQTDVWALGLIAFRMLVGRPYWLSVQDPNSSIIMLTKEILFDPLESATARAGGVALPDGFEAWFARCVARETTERFHDAEQALAAFPGSRSDEQFALSTTQLDVSRSNPNPATSVNAYADVPAAPIGSGSAPVSFAASGAPAQRPAGGLVLAPRARRPVVVWAVVSLLVAGGLVTGASILWGTRGETPAAPAASTAGAPTVDVNDRDDAVAAATEVKVEVERSLDFATHDSCAGLVADLELYGMLTGTVEPDPIWALPRASQRARPGLQRYFDLLHAGTVKALRPDGKVTERARETIGRLSLDARIDALLLGTLDEGKSWLPPSLDGAFPAVTLATLLGEAGAKQIQSRSVRAGHGPVTVQGRYTTKARPLALDRLRRAAELLQISARFTGIPDALADIEREARKLLEKYDRDYLAAWRALVEDVEVLPADGIDTAVSYMDAMGRGPYPVSTIGWALVTNLEPDAASQRSALASDYADLVAVGQTLKYDSPLMNVFMDAVAEMKRTIDQRRREFPEFDIRGLYPDFTRAEANVANAVPAAMNVGQKELIRRIVLPVFRISSPR